MLSRLTHPISCSIRPLLANTCCVRWLKLPVNGFRYQTGRHGGGRAYRSRLEPFAEFIREQRQQRRTWQEIATLLRTEKGCNITLQGLHQFYRRYLKRQARPHWESDAVMAQPASIKTPPPARKPVAATPTPRPFRQPNSDHIKLNDPTNV